MLRDQEKRCSALERHVQTLELHASSGCWERWLILNGYLSGLFIIFYPPTPQKIITVIDNPPAVKRFGFVSGHVYTQQKKRRHVGRIEICRFTTRWPNGSVLIWQVPHDWWLSGALVFLACSSIRLIVHDVYSPADVTHIHEVLSAYLVKSNVCNAEGVESKTRHLRCLSEPVRLEGTRRSRLQAHVEVRGQGIPLNMTVSENIAHPPLPVDSLAICLFVHLFNISNLFQNMSVGQEKYIFR